MGGSFGGFGRDELIRCKAAAGYSQPESPEIATAL